MNIKKDRKHMKGIKKIDAAFEIKCFSLDSTHLNPVSSLRVCQWQCASYCYEYYRL